MIRTLLCLLSLLSASVIPAAGGEIPFTVEKGYIIISAKAKKEFPIDAVIFTGSAYSFYNDAVLKRLRLQISSTNDLLTSGASAEQSVTFANIPLVSVSDEKPVEVKMRQRSFDGIVKAVGRNIDVVLGADYFEGKIVQFDFKNHVLRFLDKPPVDYGAARAAGNADSTRVTLKMDEHIQTVFGNNVTLPVADEVMLNSIRVRSLFNTGVGFPITIGPAAGKKFSGEKDASGRTQLKSISLNGYEMAEVPALLSNVWDDNEKRYAAIVGIGVLQNFTVTFDWKNKWIVLEK